MLAIFLNRNAVQRSLFVFDEQLHAVNKFSHIFCTCGCVVQVFCAELPIFLRENKNGMYRTDVYFLCKTLAEWPIFIAVPVIFVTISYPLVGLYPDLKHFLVAAATVTLVANVSTSFGEWFLSIILTSNRFNTNEFSMNWNCLFHFFSTSSLEFEYSITKVEVEMIKFEQVKFLNVKNNYWTYVTGYFISCVSKNISMALAIGPPIIIPFLLFGGFFLNTG